MVFFLAALPVIVADQLTKTWIRSYSVGQTIFEAGFFRIVHVRNTGAAFGLFQDQFWLLTVAAIASIVLILFFVLFISRRFPILDTIQDRLALGLIFGGTIGNLADRLRFSYVTDFISVGIWPTFNIADSAITIGAILFAYFFLSSSRTKDVS